METMQSKLTLPILFFVLLLAPSVYASTQVDYCDDRTKYAVKVSGVDISPNPVKRGKVATFKIAAHTDEALSGGKLNIEVKLFGVSVYSEDHDLCQETSCPVTTGDFVISHSQELPGFTPPGSYTLKMKMLDGSNSSELTCIHFDFSVAWFANESVAVAVAAADS